MRFFRTLVVGGMLMGFVVSAQAAAFSRRDYALLEKNNFVIFPSESFASGPASQAPALRIAYLASFSDLRSPALKEAVAYLVNKGLLREAALFEPEKRMSRRELMAWLGKKEALSVLSKRNKRISKADAALMLYKILLAKEDEPKQSAVVSCETCIAGIDLSKYSWSKNPVVKIGGGKLLIGGVDFASRIRNRGSEDLKTILDDQILYATLKATADQDKLNVDKLFPELYARASGIHGGAQGADGSYWEVNHERDPSLEAQYPSKMIRNKDNVKLGDCKDGCDFEEKIIWQYNEAYGHPSKHFESWIKTAEGKPFIYDVIQIYGKTEKK